MRIEIVDNHSVAVDLLTKGPVLDAGCRGFEFAEWFADRGHKVLALDPDPTVDLAQHPNILFHRQALVADSSLLYWLVLTQDRQARYLATTQQAKDSGLPAADIKTVSMSNILAEPEDVFDVVKLNIEGSELEVLRNWPGPIARQIVVSFHQHCSHANQTDEAIQGVVDHLSQWYVPVRHVKDERYSAGANFWDSLFVLKDLV